MGLLLQLKLLLWKNYMIRKRQKFRCVVELLWPLCLFTLLMLVRTKGLFQNIHQCHFEEKPLPSAGQVLFYQGLICSYNNTCHDSAEIAERGYSSLESSDLHMMLKDARSFTHKAIDVNQNLIEKFTKSAMELSKELRETEFNVSENGSINLFPNISMKSEGIQQKFNIESMNKLQKLLLLHTKLEKNLNELEPSLDTINLWERLSLGDDNISAIIKEPIVEEIFVKLYRFMCGNKTKLTMDSILSRPSQANRLENYIESLTKATAEIHYEYDPEVSKQCNKIYEKLETTPTLKPVWRVIKPYVRGKIIYSPNTTVISRVMKRIADRLAGPDLSAFTNQTNELKQSGEMYINSLNELMFIQDAYKSKLINNSVDELSTHFLENNMYKTIEKAQRLIKSYYDKMKALQKKQSFKKHREQVKEALKCYSAIKFEGYSTETEAEERSMVLSEKNNLLAMISFSNEDENILDPLTIYKLRMNAERMPKPQEAESYSFSKGPNYRPFEDLKLITYGYVYIQDLIENSIITEHTGREETPGVILKQFPHPCYKEDWFMSSLADMFPLFMVLSWVYPASMIIKSIVHEKEQKLKETMRVLGMNNGIHWCSWFIDSMIPMIITILLLSTILVHGGVLANADFSLVVVFLLCYASATVTNCFLISTLFSKANLAASSGGIIFFTSYLPFPFIESWYSYISRDMKLFACVLSNVALGLGSKYFGMRELEGTGSKWNNVSRSPVIGDTFNIMVIMIVMLMDAAFYLLLAWYIENVFPGIYGVPKPWYFLFTRNFWFPKSASPETNYNQNYKMPVKDINTIQMIRLPFENRIEILGTYYSTTLIEND